MNDSPHHFTRAGATVAFALALVTALAWPCSASAQDCLMDEKVCFGECVHLSDVCCDDGTICPYTTICCGGGACGYPPDFACGPATMTCQTVDLGLSCPTMTACCSLEECYYEADGRTFQCEAPGRCTAAAQELAMYCAGAYGGQSGSGASGSSYDDYDDYDDDGVGPPGCALRQASFSSTGVGTSGVAADLLGLSLAARLRHRRARAGRGGRS